MNFSKTGCFSFVYGKKETITNYLLKKIYKKESFTLLPTSLNDLASVDLDKSLQKSYKKIDFCTNDGMPLVWYFSLKKIFSSQKVERVYGPTLMKEILEQGNKNTRHLFYGSSQETLDLLEKNIHTFAPQTKIVELLSPPFRELTLEEEGAYISKIIAQKVDVLWIGLSSPKQVKVAARWKQFLPNTAIFCVGAAFDFLAERQSMAPKIIQQMGFEWLYRLLVDPKRLWKRYLVVIPQFLFKKIATYLFN